MRKFRIFILLFLFAAATSMFFSCAEEDALGLASEALELQSPYGKWKLEGFATTTSNQAEIVLSSNPKAYSLTLNKDSTYTGISSTNEIGGKFTINAVRRNISFTASEFYTTKVNETGDGRLYLERLFKVTQYKVYYTANTVQLHLYYSQKDYLLFNKLVDK